MGKTLTFCCLLILSGCIGTLESCGNSRTELIEYYEVVKYDEYNDGKNVLSCKLYFKNDPVIPNVQRVEWDNKYMKIGTKDGFHYIIQASGDRLCCGCGDEIIGPIDQSEFDLKVKKMKIKQRLKNYKEFKN